MESKVLRSGLKIGHLVLIEPCGEGTLDSGWGSGRDATNRVWLCRCEAPVAGSSAICGKLVPVEYVKLYTHTAYSCGCTPKPRYRPGPVTDESGKTYGRLLVMGWVDGKGWECLCDQCMEREYVRYARYLHTTGRHACSRVQVSHAGREWVVRFSSPYVAAGAVQQCVVPAAAADKAYEEFYRKLRVKVQTLRA